MVCSNCGTENEAGRKFCKECAARLAAVCPACGAANGADAKFCGECAASLAAAPSASPRSTPAPTPAPVAERRVVSILFTDLVGFTTLAEGRDAEDTRELLSRYFDLATEVIGRYGGVVEKFIGDAVMAVWGAPVAHEDDAERAVRAGLELVDAVKGLGPGTQARAGVLTGEAAVTLGATNQGMVAGDLVNTASRLQSVAAPGTVLVGEATQRAASRAIAFEQAGEQALKGKAAPVAAWRALRVVAEVGGRNRSETLEAPFVGRDDELRQLKDLFHATSRDRRARLVSVIGPAGIGKSRLAWEFSKYVDGLVETVWFHDGRSPAYGEGISFWALGEMVRRRAALLETDDEPTTRAKIAETLATHVPDETERRWIEPALLALLGIETSTGGSEQLFAAWRTFFERLAATAPVVMVFEDFHYADPGLLDFVDHLLEWSKNVPITVVTLARPDLMDKRPDWGAGKRNFTSLYLEPLPDAAMRELLAGLVPGLPAAASKAIVARADGIPLYAVETVRMLLAEGRLALEDGVYRPVGDLAKLAVPETLTALIAARLDALSPEDRVLVSDAAVLGQSFTLAGLEAVSAIPAAKLEPRLRTLVKRELLTLEADPRSPERGQYAFVQALIREVAYNTLAKKDRKTRHLAAARFFETLRTDELAGALAGHYLAARANAPEGPQADALAGQARIALKAAADRAAALGSHDQAVTFLEQALTITTDPGQRAALLEQAARSADAAGRYAEAGRFVLDAIEGHRAVGSPAAVGQLSALRAMIMIDTADVPNALVVAEAALRELPVGEDVARATLLSTLSRALFRNADNARSVAVADEALAIAERLNLELIVAESFINKGSALEQLGRRREAVALVEAGAQLAHDGGWIATEIRALINLAAALSDDDPTKAFEVGGAALDLSEKVGNRTRALFLTAQRAVADFSRGSDWEGMLRRIELALENAPEAADRDSLVAAAARLRSARSELDGSTLEGLGEIARDHPDPAERASAVVTQAEYALARGDLRGAYELAVRTAGISPYFEGQALLRAFRAALWLGDLELARAVAERHAASPFTGRVSAAERTALEAGLAALEGRTSEATTDYLDAIRRLGELGERFDQARTILDALTVLGPADTRLAAAADDARTTFERVAAQPYLVRLEAALARSADPTGDSAAVTETTFLTPA